MAAKSWLPSHGRQVMAATWAGCSSARVGGADATGELLTVEGAAHVDVHASEAAPVPSPS